MVHPFVYGENLIGDEGPNQRQNCDSLSGETFDFGAIWD
jgi:hypothetical protein